MYTYDPSNPTHLIEIQKYQTGQYPNGQDDACARVNYTYGYDPAPYNHGRLINASTLQGSCYPAPSYSESYTYGAPGNVLSKTVTASGAPWGSSAVINYGYDSYGRTTTVQYPFGTAYQYGIYYPAVTFTTTYDTMGRPNGLTDSNSNTWVNSASTVYDYAGRLQTLNFLGVTETRGYNTVGQIASIGWSNSNYGQLSGTLTYTYPSGQTGVYSDGAKASYNNGQISQMTDSISGETTVYQYDALKRVISASNSVWHETFSYDGFGNLTGKTLNGNPQSISVDSTSNRLSGPSYDLNGNMTVGAGATMTYNEDNRMSSAQVASGSVEYYYYAPDGKRFCRTMASGDTQYTLYGAYGEALGTYSAQGYIAHTEMSVYFGGRRLWQGPTYSSANGSQGAVFADRLGSNRYTGKYYPYGDAVGTAPQDQVGFATYTQDSYTGLDYAVNRMYDSKDGRFNTPDRMGGSAKTAVPGSFNRYSYTTGDPVNRNDPKGTCDTTTYSTGGDGTITVDCTDYDSGWSWGDPFDGFWESMAGPDFNPSAAAECLPGCNAQRTFVLPPLPPYIPASPGEEASSLSAAYNLAETILNQDPKCAGLFALTYSPSPQDLLSLLYHGNANYGSFTWDQLGYGVEGTTGYVASQGAVVITINDNYNGLYFTGSPLQQAQLLLHELGHAYDLLYGPSSSAIVGPDGNLSDPVQAAKQLSNDNLITSNCTH